MADVNIIQRPDNNGQEIEIVLSEIEVEWLLNGQYSFGYLGSKYTIKIKEV